MTFANEGRPPVPGEAIEEELKNLHGRTRTTCQLCGECDVGCNYGAKNTLDYNYLTHAKHHGAEIRTLCRRAPVRARATAAATASHYADLDDSARRPRRSSTLTCDHLILSAGTLGTTNLLLQATAARSRRSRASSARASAATATC